MNLLQTLEAEQMKAVRAKAHPEFRAGDTLKVNVKVVEVTYDEKAKAEKRRERLQAFEGVCIARQGAGLNESFTVRKISYGEGVERVFPVYSPTIDSVKVLRRGKVRRAKLYYLRDRDRELHRAQDLLRRRGREGVSRLLADDRLGQSSPTRQGAARQALLPARSRSRASPCARSLTAKGSRGCFPSTRRRSTRSKFSDAARCGAPSSITCAI